MAMAGFKHCETGFLLLLVACSCIVAAGGGEQDAGKQASESSCPTRLLGAQIYSHLRQAFAAVSVPWLDESADLTASVEVSGTDGEVRQTQRTAHPWPEEFTIKFTTKGGLVEGFLAYDWANKRQLIWHGTNSTYCEGFGVPDAPCSILFNGTGIFVTLPSLKQSWLETPGVGTVPPDFTVQSVYQGLEFVQGVGPCFAFGFPPTDHAYWETLDGRPCVFVFPVPDMTYYFLPDTEEIGVPDEEFFALPPYFTPTRPSRMAIS